MLRMILRPGRTLSAMLALGALTAAGTVTSAQAQEARPRVRVERDDCRCVDRDGKEIEKCTCFRSPDVSGILARVLPLRASRVRLGVTISEELNAADASQGARIESVLEDGPADEAGLQEGDIITALDGKSLLRPLDQEAERDFDLDGSVAVQRLMAVIAEVEPGQEVRVDYLRDGQAGSATVTAKEMDNWGVRMEIPRWRSRSGEMGEAMGDLRERLRDLPFEGRETHGWSLYAPDAPHAPVRIRAPRMFFGHSGECPGERTEGMTLEAFSTNCVSGVALEEMNPKLGEYFGTTRGVLVTNADEDTPLGLQPGDVILDIGGREATDSDRVRRILQSYDEGEEFTLRIMRQKREMSVQGSLGH